MNNFSTEQLAGIIAAVAIGGRLCALLFAIFSGAYFQRAADSNVVKDMLWGMIFLLLAISSSAISIVLSAGVPLYH